MTCSRSDDDGLVDFFTLTYARLVGALSLFCGRPEIAEELAQEAMVRASRDWIKVQKLDDPERWLYRVAFNLAKSHFRRLVVERRALRRVANENRVSSLPGDTSDAIEVRAAVAALPQRQKEALVSRYFLGLSVRESASVMDCADGTVQALTHKAILNLRRSLGSDFDSVGGRNEIRAGEAT